MPLALFATFAVMYLLDFSMNNLSLMALALSVGFVVDDAIVVLENIVRHVELGKPPRQAAFEASQEIGFTIVSMTLSLAAVFLPFLFLGGIIGRLFQEFAVTIAVAIRVSGAVSLSLTPMLAARWLRPHSEATPHGKFYQVTERGLNALTDFYDRTLLVVLRHPRLTLATSFLILLASVALFLHIPKGFLPTEDNDQLSVTTEAVEGISYAAVARTRAT